MNTDVNDDVDHSSLVDSEDNRDTDAPHAAVVCPDGKQCFDLFGQYICVNDHALHPRSCEGRCRNGGTCIGEGFEARCECPDHTSGEFCEQKVTTIVSALRATHPQQSLPDVAVISIDCPVLERHRMIVCEWVSDM